MSVFDAAKQKVMGFIDSVMGAIGKVGQLLGLTNDASKVSVAVNSGGRIKLAQSSATTRWEHRRWRHRHGWQQCGQQLEREQHDPDQRHDHQRE